MILSEIASGHIDGADVCFLIAVILFALATILAYRPVPERPPFAAILAYAGATALALGFLLL
jgi:small-conductance mechanosensitive channel